MRKIKGYIFALILCILFMCSGCGNPESQTGQGSPELYQDARQQADGHAAADSLPETEALLKEDQVLELGDHMVACHVHREAVEKGIDGFGSLHLWNPDMSSLVVCADENDIGYWAKEMYAWVEGSGGESVALSGFTRRRSFMRCREGACFRILTGIGSWSA